jgi:hypothetical protein
MIKQSNLLNDGLPAGVVDPLVDIPIAGCRVTSDRVSSSNDLSPQIAERYSTGFPRRLQNSFALRMEMHRNALELDLGVLQLAGPAFPGGNRDTAHDGQAVLDVGGAAAEITGSWCFQLRRP